MNKVSNEVNLNYLKFFITAVESKTYQEVSKKLGYTVSTVSSSIKSLEKQLGVKLINRERIPIEPTEKGEEVYKIVKDIYNNVNLMLLVANKDESVENKKVIIGCPQHIANFYLSEKLKKFEKSDDNNFEVELECETNCNKLLDRVRKANIQFALIDFIPTGEITKYIKLRELFETENVFVSKKKVKIKDVEDLKNYKFILGPEEDKDTVELNKCLKQHNVKLNASVRNADTMGRINATKMDMGIAYVTRDAVKEELKSKELYEVKVPVDLPTTTTYLVYLKDYLSENERDFIEKYFCKLD